ncbi:MAG: hypothetical protein FWG73_01160 [Planctomycetaceae bacterium]|nr:hypothetical protein [Planctomycetaceae bacterium]
MKNSPVLVLLERIPNGPGQFFVIPAQAGNQENGMHAARLDSGLRRNDDVFAGMTEAIPGQFGLIRQ